MVADIYPSILTSYIHCFLQYHRVTQGQNIISAASKSSYGYLCLSHNLSRGFEGFQHIKWYLRVHSEYGGMEHYRVIIQ